MFKVSNINIVSSAKIIEINNKFVLTLLKSLIQDWLKMIWLEFEYSLIHNALVNTRLRRWCLRNFENLD